MDGELDTSPPDGSALVDIATIWALDFWLFALTGRRPENILGGLLLSAVGSILLAKVKTSVGGRYVGALLNACTNWAVAPLLAMRTSTVYGASATAVASAGITAFVNLSALESFLERVHVCLSYGVDLVLAQGPGPVHYEGDIEGLSKGRKDKDMELAQVSVEQV
ncbi:hypothetical protein L486_01672 [Kwoniella mangroviensis CBS 10435]|uniref:Uncharacterized protein n=1 Tax=Kwoniella mangroviensis CBS 10435 TaxID=1331196 RepID=A0A1B9J2I5_9TREE|nr:hypothetical protein L486_01672 [Kwoniella mangroviensis CBS 10435]